MCLNGERGVVDRELCQQTSEELFVGFGIALWIEAVVSGSSVRSVASAVGCIVWRLRAFRTRHSWCRNTDPNENSTSSVVFCSDVVML